MTDVLDALTGSDELGPDDRDGEQRQRDGSARGMREMDRPGTFVCDKLIDGHPCGKTFTTKRALAGHTTTVHVMKGKLKEAARAVSDNRDEQPTRKKKSPQQKAAQQAAPTPPNVDRAALYTASLTSVALIAHVAAGQYFDAYDLEVVTVGAPPFCAALDQVGESNEAIRKACDLILGGGGASGLAWLQLFVAASGIAVPILAHHGALPEEVGKRFAAMTGAMVGSVPPSPPPTTGDGITEPPTDHRPSPDPANWTRDEWLSVLMHPTALTVIADVARENGMADLVPPTVVDVPPSFSEKVTSNGDNGAGPADPEGSENQDTVPADEEPDRSPSY